MRWTDKEVEYLKSNFSEKTYRQIATYLKKTPSSVAGKAQELQLQRAKEDVLWTAEELKYLNDRYSDTPISELAGKLKRSKQSVRSKMWNLDLKPFYNNKVSDNGKVKKYMEINTDDLAIIEKKYGSLRKMIEAIAESLR